MSISFHVRCPAPDVQVLAVAQLALIDVDPPTGRWPEGRVLHAYLPGVSTRCIPFCWREGSFEARILALSCPADHQAAQRVVRTLAAEAGAQVTCEDGGTYDPKDPAPYGPDWLEAHLRAEIEAVIAMARTHDEPLEVLGLHRPWTMDRAFAETLAALDPQTRAQTLFTTLRAAVQPVPTGSEPPAVEAGPDAVATPASASPPIVATPAIEPGPASEVDSPETLAPMYGARPTSFSDEPTEEAPAIPRTPAGAPPPAPTEPVHAAPEPAPAPVAPPIPAPPAAPVDPHPVDDPPTTGTSPLVVVGAVALLVAVFVGAWMVLG